MGQFFASAVLKGVETLDVNNEWAYRIPFALQWVSSPILPAVFRSFTDIIVIPSSDLAPTYSRWSLLCPRKSVVLGSKGQNRRSKEITHRTWIGATWSDLRRRAY